MSDELEDELERVRSWPMPEGWDPEIFALGWAQGAKLAPPTPEEAAQAAELLRGYWLQPAGDERGSAA